MVTVIGGIVSSFTEPDQTEVATNQQLVIQEQLQQQEAGFEAVLEREPDNPNALQGLVRIRLEQGDLRGAVEPLDQLIVLFPEDQVLKDLQAQVNENLARQNGAAPATGESPAAVGNDGNVSPLTPPENPETP